MATATAPVTLNGAVGAYKDIQPVKYSKEKELEGTGEFAAATFPNYLPVWVSSGC
jgi:sulfonate dioxygenase